MTALLAACWRFYRVNQQFADPSTRVCAGDVQRAREELGEAALAWVRATIKQQNEERAKSSAQTEWNFSCNPRPRNAQKQ